MPEVSISFAASAVTDLEHLKDWYVDQGVPDVADRLIAEIFERIDTLRDHPEIGRIVPEFDQPFLRELVHRPFRIVYLRKVTGVRIVRVWRSDRLLRLSAEDSETD